MDEQEITPKGKMEDRAGEAEPLVAPRPLPGEAHETMLAANAASNVPMEDAPTAVSASQNGAAPVMTGYPNPTASPLEVLPIVEGEAAEREMRQISRRSFLWAGVALAGVFVGQRWLNSRPEDNGIVWPLRRSLDINDQIALDYFRDARLTPTFPRAMAKEPRQNGDYGVDSDLDPDWKLSLMGLPDADAPTLITLADIKKLRKTEMVTELKCIEGWSVVVHWGGVLFADFIAHYWPKSADHPISELPAYVAMETPDGAYYVGLDKASAMHPQTLLAYEMNGKPLPDEHGAPLRLAIPTKYGIKNIKRIGTIRLADARPKDYWAEQGYDWYAGH